MGSFIAKKVKYIDSIVVSTEDEEIAEISRFWGANVPFMRPHELAQNETPGIDLVLHALAELPEFDQIMLLQPTSPLRTTEDIEGIYHSFIKKNAQTFVSISEVSNHPNRVFKRDLDGCITPFVKKSQIKARRQDLPKAYVVNGALYLSNCDWILKNRTFFSEDTYGYVMPIDRSIDIDTPFDWDLAEYFMKKMMYTI